MTSLHYEAPEREPLTLVDPITSAGQVDPITDDPFGLEDRAAAWLAGYDLGVTHGRTAERAVIDQEQRSARAGAIVARMATYPPRDRAADRAAAAAREARWSA